MASRAAGAGLAMALALATLSGVPARAAPGVSLLGVEPSGLRFRVDVPEISLEPAVNDSSLSTLEIDGFELDGAPETAALPMRVITVAVPPTGRVTVQATGTAVESHSAVRLEALPRAPRTAPGSAAEETPRAALALETIVRPLARVLDVSWMRDQRVARIAIAPVRWEPGTGALTVQHRIEVSVRFEAPSAQTPAAGTDAFEPAYRLLLVNYEQGRAWRRAPSPGSASFLDPAAARPAAVVPDNSLYAGRDWVKIAIPAAGFYKVEFAQLLNTRVFGGKRDTPLDAIRLFTWPGVPVLPEDSYCDSCGYQELAAQFVEFPMSNTNPPKPNLPLTFDDNREYVYFYALGPSDWADLYDSSKPETSFVNNPYETRNFVYLTVDRDHTLPNATPLRIGTQTSSFTLDDTLTTPIPATFDARAHVEVDDGTEYFPDATPVVGLNPDGSYRMSGEAWEKFFWLHAAGGQSLSESFDLPGLDPGAQVHARVRAWGLSALAGGSSKTVGFPDHFLDIAVGRVQSGNPSILFPTRSWDGLTSQTFDTTGAAGADFAETGNTLRFSVPRVLDPNPARFSHFDRIGLAWLEAYYPRRFAPDISSELTFDSDPAAGTRLYRVGPFTGPNAATAPRVFDVTDPLVPVEILGGVYHPLSADSWELLFGRTETGRHRYRIVTDASFVKPPNADVFDAPISSKNNLRKPTVNGKTGGDFLVIYYDAFKTAADSLLAWRAARVPGIAAPDTFSVPVSALYDQFSGGRTDPGAIRNFLRAAYTYWIPRPTYVTLLGDGSYDFKNLTGQAPPGQPGALIPAYENGYDTFVQREFATDDWMLNVDDPVVVVPDFFGGRIPAGDADQAMRYVRDRLLPYERSAPLGEWRDRVMLIADDNLVSGTPDFIGWRHVEQSATLDRQGLPPEFDRDYVYLHTYPDRPNHTKPLAKADIVAGLQDGVVMANYIGHGSPFQLADESVFLNLDALHLTNKTRPTIFVAASCDVGKFDNPGVTSLGEDLVLSPAGGAVAVVSATELAISTQNASLNLALYQNLFARADTSGQFETALSPALLAIKTGLANSQKYQVMGDAAVKPVFPRLWAETTLEDSSGQTVTSGRRGQTLRVVGRLLDRPGGTLQAYDGVARVLIEDSAPIDTAGDCSPQCFSGAGATYPFRAAPVFRGDVAIRGGTFSTSLVMPMNAELGPRARARLYGELQQGAFITDAVGSDPFAVTGGFIPAGDREGPRITLGFRGGSTTVRPDALLRVDLFDESGILITGHTPQNDIIVTLDDDSNQRTDITSTFRYAANSYQSGTAFFQLPGLSIGPHRVRVSAADNLAAGIAAPDHRSSASLDFEVTASPALKVTRALLFPNPTRSGGLGGGGQFVIDAPGDSVNVLLKIYTVGGRLVRTLESHGGLAQVQIPWDGLDAEGERLAQGTYLFKAQVYPRDVKGGSSSGGRADAEGKLVILSR